MAGRGVGREEAGGKRGVAKLSHGTDGGGQLVLAAKKTEKMERKQ